ncbi:MAG: DUF58 domain-containing protein [Myxococcota bacterium]|nr:DUF58 domain-containing protein [Myxococcota bacterium]
MSQVWSPEIIERAAALHLQARQLVWGYRFGLHRSPKITRSVEFAEHKEYSPGDSVRDIDWRVFARTERLLVRRQQADTELSVVLALDASGDMAIGAAELPSLTDSRFGKAITLAATLALLAQRRGEKVGLFIMGGEGQEVNWLRPQSSRNQLAAILNHLAAIRPKNNANLEHRFQDLGHVLPKRSLVFVLSDFMEEPQRWGPSLSGLAAMGADLRLVHLYSQKEFALSFDETAQFLSPEESSPLNLDSTAIRQSFLGVVDEYLDELKSWSAKSRAVYIPCAYEETLERTFIQMLRGV